MAQRKTERVLAIPVWHRKEMRLIPPGEPVNLEHLTDEEYERFSALYPDDMPAAEQKRLAAERAADHEAKARI